MTHIIRNFNAFFEGHSTHLECEEVTAPNVRDQVEEVKGGGLLAPYDVALGFQKMEARVKINSRQREIMKLVGLAPGVHKAITFRTVGISEIDGETQGEVMSLTGRVNMDQGNWSAQNKAMIDFNIGSILYYKHVIDGQVMHHIDVKNFIGIVDGVDRWADVRSGLGL